MRKALVMFSAVVLLSGCDSISRRARAVASFDFSQRGLYPTLPGTDKLFKGVIEYDERIIPPPSGSASSPAAQNQYSPGYGWYTLRTNDFRYRFHGAEFPELYPYAGNPATVEGKLVQYEYNGELKTRLAPSMVTVYRR